MSYSLDFIRKKLEGRERKIREWKKKVTDVPLVLILPTSHILTCILHHPSRDVLRTLNKTSCSVCKVHFGASYIIYSKLGSSLLKQHGGLLELIRVLCPVIAITQFHRLWNVTSSQLA